MQKFQFELEKHQEQFNQIEMLGLVFSAYNKYFMNQRSRELQQQVLKLREQIEELKEEAKTYERTINIHKANIENNNTHISALRGTINNLEGKIKRLEASLKNQKNCNQALKNELNAQIGLCSKAQKEHQQAIQDLSSMFRSKFSSIEKMESSQPSIQFQALKQKLRIIINQSQKLTDQKKKIQQRLKEVQETCQNYQNSTIQQKCSENNSTSNIYLPSQIREFSNIVQKPQNLNETTKKHEIKEIINQVQNDDSITKEIHICNLEERVKELENDLLQANRENRFLKQKIEGMMFESQARENIGRQFEPSELDSLKLIQRRRLEFEGELIGNDQNLAASMHKPIFTAISNHYEVIAQTKKVPFLNMLNFWSEQRLKSIYQSMQDLSGL